MSQKEEPFTLECVNCKTKFPVDFDQMKPGITHTCPLCGQTYESKSDKMKDVEDMIKKYRFNNKIKVP